MSGVLCGLTFLPLQLGILIYIGLVPILIIWIRGDLRTSIVMTIITACSANCIAFYWMGLNKGAAAVVALSSLIGAVLYLSLFWVGVGICVTIVQKKWNAGLLLFPFIWVAMEFIRSIGAMAFPMGDLAVTQVSILPLIQTADVGGTAGIAFFICLCNGLLYLAIVEKKSIQYLIGTAVLWLIFFGFGLWRIQAVDERLQESNYRVAVLQPNVDPLKKWDRDYEKDLVALMDSLTVVAMKLEPDIVLWPESALPVYLRISNLSRQQIQERVDHYNISLLAGTVDLEIDPEGTHYYNCAMLFQPGGGDAQLYYKLHLVPFAEFIPFSKYFPSLKKLNFGQGNFEQGEEYTVFMVADKQFGNMICYESSMPRIARKFITRGADFLTIQSNDSWSGDSPCVDQHFALAQLRAVENRVPIARSANMGISGIIAPSGRVLEKLDFNVQGIIISSLPFLTDQWPTNTGDTFALICIFIGLGISFWQWKRKRL